MFSFAFSLNVFSNAACQHLNIRYTSVSIIGVPLQDCIQLSRANTYSWCTFCLCSFFRSTICIYINCDCFRFSVENVSRTTRKWFFLQLYNYPTGGQLFVFILMIDIFLFRSFPSHHLLGFRFSTFSHKEERCCQPITRSTSSKHADLSIYIWHIIFIGIWFFQYIQIFGCPWIFLWVVTLHLHPIQNNCVQWGIFFCDQWRHLTFNRKSPQPVSW